MREKKFPKGLHTHRFKSNPAEKQFAEAWENQNKHGDNLAHLLDERQVRTGRPNTPSDRDYQVAATVIQWLGSEVGQNFLRDNGFIAISEKKATKEHIRAMRKFLGDIAERHSASEDIVALYDFFQEMRRWRMRQS